MISLSSIAQNMPVSRKFLGYGDEAIHNTLILMARIIKESASNYYVRRWAEYILAGVLKDEYSRVQALYDFLASNVQYLRDMEGFEMLKKPEVALRELEQSFIPQLDCDCMSILIGSLARSIGLPVAIRAIAPQNKSKFSHVYTMIKIKNHGWVAFDLTKPGRGLGWEYSKASRVMTKKVV